LLLPQSNSQVQAKPVTTVSITRDLQFYYETTRVDFDQLEPLLKAKLSGTQDPTVSLHVDRSVPMEQVVRVMNIAQRNRFRLILATAPEGR